MIVIQLIQNGYEEDVVIPENDEERTYLKKRYLSSPSIPQGFPFDLGAGQEVVDDYNKERKAKP